MCPQAAATPGDTAPGRSRSARAEARAARTAAGSPPLTTRELPAWPYLGLFLLYPLWWTLGVTAAILPVLGGVCLVLMVLRGRVRLPGIWLPWTSFLVWMAASGVMIDSAGRMIGFGQRLGDAVGATLVVLYLFNAGHALPRRRVMAAMTVFLGWMTIGGYLGMLFPDARVRTPAIALAPPALAANDYVLNLLSPRFAEVQQPYGAEVPFVRPSAPFPYTNAWGHAFVLLLPVVAALAVHASRRTRWLLLVLVAAAVPPALATLNRGVFVGVAVGLTYLGLRSLRRATPRRVLHWAAAGAGLAAVVVLSGVPGRVGDRLSTSSSTQDRAALYREALRRTLESPWLGWGAPRPSQDLDVSVGTQGHFWYLMFSHGFVGLGLFLATVWGLAVLTRRTRDTESLLLHTVVVVIGVMLLFYGVTGVHLVIALSCGVLLLRPDEAPSQPSRWSP